MTTRLKEQTPLQACASAGPQPQEPELDSSLRLADRQYKPSVYGTDPSV